MLIPFRFSHKTNTGAENGRSGGSIRRSARAFGRFMDPRPVLKESLPAFRVGYILYRAAVVFFLELSYRLKGYEIRRPGRDTTDHQEKPLGGQ